MSKTNHHHHPDGGCMAWTIVTTSFMVSFLLDGLGYNFGIILPSISDHFGVGRAESSLTNSIMTAILYGSGPFAAFMVKRWSHRNTVIIGSFLSTLGLFLSGLYIKYTEDGSDNNILVLYVTIGVMTGLGFGLMYLPAMDIVEIYFSDHLGLATGITAAGSGFGQFCMAPVIHYVEEQMGLGNTMFTLSCMVSTSILFGLIYRLHEKKHAVDLTEIQNMVDQVEKEQIHSNELQNKNKNSTYLQTGLKEDTMEKVENRNYSQIFKSPQMIILLISFFFIDLGVFVAFNFTTDRASMIGIERKQSGLLLSIMGVSNCIARVVFGRVLDKYRKKAIQLTTCVLFLNALSVTVSVALTSFVTQAVYCAVFGATFGAYFSSVVVILKIINDDITISLGVVLFTHAFASLVGPASVGYIFDKTESYTPGFLVVGILSLLAASLLPVILYIPKKSNKHVVCEISQDQTSIL